MKALKKGTKKFLASVACVAVFGVIVGAAVGVHFLRKEKSGEGTSSADAPSLVVLMRDSRVYYKTEEHLAAGKKFYIKIGYEDKNGEIMEFSAEEAEREVKFEPSEDFLEVRGDGEMVVKEDKFTDPFSSAKAYPVTIKISSSTDAYKSVETTVNVVPCPTSHVRLDGNGQTLDKEIVDVWEGEKLSEGGFPTVPQIENYTFAGWYRVENGVVGSEPVDLNTRYYFGDEMTLRARWLSDVPIQLKADGLGEDVELGRQYYNENLPALPSLEETDGWTFDGWYTGIGGAGDLVEGGKPYSKSKMQLYAKWTGSVALDPILPTKQEVPSSISVIYHAAPDFPSDPEYRDDGQFIGWYTENGDSGSLVAKGERFAERDISALTLFAKVQFPIIFDWKEATPEATSQDAFYAIYNGSMQSLRYFLPKPADEAENGWNWNGWFVEKDGELIEFNETTHYQTAARLRLVCTRTSQFTLHDELNRDGVATNATKTVQAFYGEPLPLDGLSKLEATNWNFEGYNTARGGNGTALYEVKGNVLESKNGYTGEGGLHLYAKWTSTLLLNYTLESTTIDHSRKGIGVTYYSNPNLPVLTYSNDGKFGGWYTEQAGGGEKIDPEVPYTGKGRANLYDAIRFTITRDFQDEVLNAQEETEIGIFYGQAINRQSVFPDYKTKQGWKFDGWYSLSDPNGTPIQYERYDIPYNIKVYAWWKSTVHFYQELDIDGSHLTDSFTQTIVHYNQPFSAPEGASIVLTAQGWEFGGFYTEVGGAGTQIYTKEGTPAQSLYLEKGGISLYAKWTSHSIKLDDHGFKTTETIPLAFTVVYHAVPQGLPRPVYVNYATVPDKQDGQFAGWYTSADYNDDDRVSEDVPYTGAPDSTFYAKIVFKVILNYMDAEIKDSNPTKWVDMLEAVYGRTYRQSNKEDFELPIPTKGRWTFSGWCVEGYDIDGQAISVSPDMRYDLDFAATLYARWTTQFKLMREIGESGRIDDNSYSFLMVEYKKDVTLPTLEADGWSFDGWYDMYGGQGDGYDSGHLTLSAYEGKTGRTLYAKWKTTLTSKNFEAFLDTAPGTDFSKEVVYKGEIGELPSPSYQNSEADFLGWNFDAYMEGRDIEETTIFHYSKDIKFYAKVGLKLKIVKEDAVTDQEIEEEYKVLYNAKISINGKLPTLENTPAWNFAGYYTERYGEGEQITNNTIFVDKRDKTIYAKWDAEITLSYVIKEYSIDEKVPVIYGGPLELPHDASIGAWHLSGWCTNLGYKDNDIVNDADIKLSNTQFGKTTLYAQWKADIVLNARGGEPEPKPSVLGGVIYGLSLERKGMTLPTGQEMTRTDYIFGGWFADLHEAEAFDETWAIANGKTSEVTDTTTEYPLNIQTLYAKWRPKSADVELDPNYNGGSVQTIKVFAGQPMPEVEAPKPQTASGSDPLTFVGYFFHPSGKGDDPTGAIQYYAPAGAKAQSVHLWDMGTGIADPPIRLYAHWENMFVVTWMLDDEKTILETDNVQKPGGSIGAQHPVYDKQTMPAKESTPQYDYEFIGWKVKGDPAHKEDDYMLKAELSDGKYTYSEYNITCSITLIAVFEAKTRSYTVTWLNDDGSQLRADTVEYGKQPTYTETPTKEQTAQYSYEFAGWKGADGTLHEGPLDPVTGDVTYRAHYNSKIRSYTVTWENWNGEQLYQLTLDYGTDLKEKYKGPEPTREKTDQYEYTFSGWSPEVTDVTGDITYTAQYTAKTREYIVTWKNGSSVIAEDKVLYGEKPKYKEVTREHDGNTYYTFIGWSETEGGSLVSLDTITITGNKTFYAKFDSEYRNPCLVTGTLITLADGSKVPVETLTGNEIILVWDFENGCIAERPILFVAHKDENAHPKTVRVIHLTFSDGTYIEIVGQDGFWNVDRNMAVYINEGNYSEYIGETFKKQTGNGWIHVQLVAVDLIVRYTNYWSPISTEHMGFFANDLLVFPGLTKIFNNIFEVDPDTMKYDEAKMQADIEKYGLYTCEEFLAEFPIPASFFKAFDVKYLKIAFGKGLITWDDIYKLVEDNGKYLLFG